MNKHNDISLTSSLTKIESEYLSLFWNLPFLNYW